MGQSDQKGVSATESPYFRPLESHLSSRTQAYHIGILILVKLCSCFSIFLMGSLVNAKLSHTVPWVVNSQYSRSSPPFMFLPFIQILTCIQLGSGLVFMILLSILKVKSLPKLRDICQQTTYSYWVRLIPYTCCSVLVLSLRIGGLQLCGPFRTVFVGTYYDVILAGVLGVLMLKSTSKYHLQGVALLVLGIFLEYVFDDSHLDHANEPWSKYTNSIGLSLLISSALLKFMFNRIGFSVSLVKASGGPVQLHSISTFISGVILLIVCSIYLMTGAEVIFVHFMPVTFIVIFGFVLDFYVETVMIKRIDESIAARVGTTTSFFSAFILALVLSQVGNATMPGIMSLLAIGLVYIATFCLTISASGSDLPFAYSAVTSDDILSCTTEKSFSNHEDLSNHNLNQSLGTILIA